MVLQIDPARTDRSKLPKFIRFMYWLGFTCTETPDGYLFFEDLTRPVQ